MVGVGLKVTNFFIWLKVQLTWDTGISQCKEIHEYVTFIKVSNIYLLKVTVSVISSDPSCKVYTVPLKALSDQE